MIILTRKDTQKKAYIFKAKLTYPSTDIELSSLEFTSLNHLHIGKQILFLEMPKKYL